MSNEAGTVERESTYPPSEPVILDSTTLVLNDSESFAIFDSIGDIDNRTYRAEGIFHHGMRYVSAWRLLVFGQRPLLLSSSIREGNDLLSADLTTPPLETQQGPVVKGTVHIWRRKFIRNGICIELLTLTNHSQNGLDIPISVQIDADFQDVFELRGFSRQSRRPQIEKEINAEGQLILRYQGLDGVERKLITEVHHPGMTFDVNGTAELLLHLSPAESKEIELSLTFELKTISSSDKGFVFAEMSQRRAREEKGLIASVITDNAVFNHWLARSHTDMLSLLGRCGAHWYPFAGVPWYNTVFGRDGLFTAMQMLVTAPEIARNVLDYLSIHQARRDQPELDAEVGKILHEERHGELAAIGEVPFQRYYGTVDATPVFVWLAGLYYKRTGNIDFIKKILPSIRLALLWLDTNIDQDDKCFVRYSKRCANGLDNQGWKDSFDGINHQTGELLAGRIALCEVQGYAFQAWLSAARLFEALEEPTDADSCRQKAIAMRQRFSSHFWDEDRGYVHLALDGKDRPARVLSSDAGHCLTTGIVSPAQANAIARRLFSKELFSGWGIRTLGNSEKRYNPMSYHNGSVWPHDNAFIAMGLHYYGLKPQVIKLTSALFEASMFFPLQRLPELYCGFERRAGEGPTHYPVACSPQAWATGVPYQLLQALLGIEISATQRLLYVRDPVLPDFLKEIEFHSLPLANGEFIDMRFVRYRGNVTVEIGAQPGSWRVEIQYFPGVKA